MKWLMPESLIIQGKAETNMDVKNNLEKFQKGIDKLQVVCYNVYSK